MSASQLSAQIEHNGTTLIVFAVFQVGHAFRQPEIAIGTTLLDAVGYVIIAIAVFDVAKYLLEEEVVRARDMSSPGEARRSMTKFLSVIVIAVFLEALVAVFQTGKEKVELMLYPTLLLIAGVVLIVGLGAYQRLSASVEQQLRAADDRGG